jgi:hypothetical protein
LCHLILGARIKDHAQNVRRARLTSADGGISIYFVAQLTANTPIAVMALERVSF